MSFEHLYSESMTLVVRPDHALLKGTLTRIVDYPVVLPQAGTTIRRYVDSLFIQLGIGAPPRRLETLSVALSQQYVRLSDAVWVAPLDAVRQGLARGELVELELGLKEPGGSVGICSNPMLASSLATQFCCEAFREAAAARRSHP